MSSGEDQRRLPQVSTFRDLLAWQAAKLLALEVLRACERPENETALWSLRSTAAGGDFRAIEHRRRQ
jgi:hypothetical protein